MIKLLFVLIISLPFSSQSQNRNVFTCKSPSQSFEIEANYRTKLLSGTLRRYSEKPIVMSCLEKAFGYECTKNDYIAKVHRGASGRMIVELQLSGDFGIESGYLYSINCP